jgi:OPT family oligopeptide transporter
MSGIINRFTRRKEQPLSSESNATSHELHEDTFGSFDNGKEKEAGGLETTIGAHSDDVESPVAPDSSDEEAVEDDLKDYPTEVRNTVSFEDDVTLPTITFRYFVLTFVFTAPGAFLYQMVRFGSPINWTVYLTDEQGIFRTTASPYSVFFVQIASHYAGVWLAKVLPSWQIKVPFTKWGFNLNPGPWSIKEHVLVTVSAASGATSNAAWVPISLSQLYYDDPIPAAACIFFMWAIVFLGYSLAAVARQFLLYDPQYPWPQALMQTSLFETFRKSDANSRSARKQLYVFLGVLFGITLWEFLPEYAFPMLSSLSFLCWVAPRNAVANFIGAGIGGMGFLNLTLDWSNISNGTFSNPMIAPFWTSVVIFAGFVVNCWILLPAAKWGNLSDWNHQLMSNRLFLENGTKYPVTEILGANNTFNEAAYEKLGPAYMGPQIIWATFFDYASYTSAFVWMILFGWPQIRTSIAKLRARAKTRGTESINEQYSDRLNVMQRAYKEVPLWWYIVLFAACFVTITTLLGTGHFFLPVWMFIVALLFSFVVSRHIFFTFLGTCEIWTAY